MRKVRVKMLVTTAICGAATVFQLGLPTSCAQFGLQTAFSVFDSCAILNCEDGVFFNLCEPFVTLLDCPNLTADTTP